MYLELVILGGKKEEEVVQDIRRVVSGGHRGDGLLRFVLRNRSLFVTGSDSSPAQGRPAAHHGSSTADSSIDDSRLNG